MDTTAGGDEHRFVDRTDGLCEKCGNPPEAHMIILRERRWMERREVFLRSFSGFKWFDVWFNPETRKYELEQTPEICETCRFWDPKIDLDADTIGRCEKWAKDTHNSHGCVFWNGSESLQPGRYVDA